MDNFVNLHVHTNASLKDSVIQVDGLVDLVCQYNQSAVAVTDHSSCAAWIDLNKECNAKGIKPIFGNEFYCYPKGVNKTRDRDHLVMLAMNQDGLVNIRRFQRLAVENSYYKPILTYETLEENPHYGIYCTSACSLGSISKAILNQDMSLAEYYCEYFNDIFDGHFALELQFHPDYDDQKIINEKLVDLSDKLSIPLTVSCDSHFLNENDRELRKILQAISWKKQWDDEDLKDSLVSNCVGNSSLVRDFAVKSKFPYMHVIQQAIDQTSKIANMCEAKLEEPQRRIPVFDKHNEFIHLLATQTW